VPVGDKNVQLTDFLGEKLAEALRIDLSHLAQSHDLNRVAQAYFIHHDTGVPVRPYASVDEFIVSTEPRPVAGPRG